MGGWVLLQVRLGAGVCVCGGWGWGVGGAACKPLAATAQQPMPAGSSSGARYSHLLMGGAAVKETVAEAHRKPKAPPKCHSQ